MPKKRPAIDETVVAMHADDLARIVPLLGIDDLPEFWGRIRRTWSVSDLQFAVGRFEADRDVEPFRRLLLEPAKRVPRGHWIPWDRVEKALSDIIPRIGRFPSDDDLERLGLKTLGTAIYHHHGGFHATRARMGQGQARVLKGHWENFDNVEKAIVPLIERLGRFPTLMDMRNRGLDAVLGGIDRHHRGLSAVCVRMGHKPPHVPKNHWKDFSNVEAALRPVCDALGRFPTQRELHAAGLGSLAQDTYHGGMRKIGARLGYGPVTDSDVARHADALARIIPTVEGDSAPVWELMKRSWTSRDLDAAISAYASTNSLDAFRRLLDGLAIPPRD